MNGMHIKADVQGMLIYGAMAAFAICLALTFLWLKSKQTNAKLRRLISPVFVSASLVSIVSVAYRGLQVNHLPMQNMFEVFLFLGACIGPIHWFSSKVIGLKHPVLMAVDALIGIVVLFPAGFVFNHQPQFLPPALQSWLFGPHVAAYMLAYIFMAKAAVFAAAGNGLQRNTPAESVMSDFAYKMTAAGFALLTLGLFLGSVWGKLAWGDWWGWDPKELWSLVCWLIFGIYLHLRVAWPRRFRLHNVFILLGMAAIIITLLWVNLSRIFAGLHNYAA